MKSNTI